MNIHPPLSPCPIHMTMHLRIAAFVILLLLVGAISTGAQEFELFSYRFESIAASGVKNPQPAALNGEVESTQQDIKLGVPIPLFDGGFVLIPQVFYNKVTLEFQGFDTSANPNIEDGFVRSFYGLKYQLGTLFRLSESTRVSIFGSIGRFSDSSSPAANGERRQGGIVVLNKLGPDSVIGYGVVVLNDFGDRQVFPALRYKSKGNAIKTDVLLPTKADVRYLAGDSLQIGVQVRITGNKYRLNNNTAGGAIDQLSYSVGTAGIVFGIGDDEGLQLEIIGGSTFRRKYEVLLGDTVVREIELENNSFLRAGLLYKL